MKIQEEKSAGLKWALNNDEAPWQPAEPGILKWGWKQVTYKQQHKLQRLISLPLSGFMNKKRRFLTKWRIFYINCVEVSQTLFTQRTVAASLEITRPDTSTNSSPACPKALSWFENCDWIYGTVLLWEEKDMKEMMSLIESSCSTETTILANTDVRLF